MIHSHIVKAMNCLAGRIKDMERCSNCYRLLLFYFFTYVLCIKVSPFCYDSCAVFDIGIVSISIPGRILHLLGYFFPNW